MLNVRLLCDGCVTNQADESFSLWQSLNEQHQQAIIDAANHDQLIIDNTSDATRFASPEKFAEWLTTKPISYALTPKDSPNVLSGLIWFVKLALPDEVTDEMTQQTAGKTKLNTDWTFAIRLYEHARGQRLSYPFMTKVFEYFWRDHPHQAVWLSTAADNAVAKKIYSKFGFTLIATSNNRAYYLIEPPH